MRALIVRLDPDLPIAWESLDTLRIGFDRAEVRLRNPSPGAQRFIGLLRTGVVSTRLTAAAKKAGLAAGSKQALLERLAPVLLYQPIEQGAETLPPPRIAVSGDGALAAALRRELPLAGFCAADEAHSADFALFVERFLRPAQQAQLWLSQDTPHLPIRMTDRSLCVGPLVPPYGAPCLACVELHERSSRPHAAVLAAQLCDQRPAAETEAVCRFAVSLAMSLVTQWLRGDTELCGVRLHYAVRAGVPSMIPELESFTPHPQCACSSLRAPIAA